jgi:hypothetical protein
MAQTDRRADRLAQIRAQIGYHRQRLVLYERLHGSQPSARLAELQHAYLAAKDRLDAAAPDRQTPDGDTRRHAAGD